MLSDPDKSIIHTLFTDHDSNIDFQEAHTDYDYITRKKGLHRPNPLLMDSTYACHIKMQAIP
jgi:hypothetical protein